MQIKIQNATSQKEAAHITGHFYILLMCFSMAFAEADEGDCRCEEKCRNLPKAAP